MAQEALRRKPDYPEAYNNIAAAYEAMSMWDPAIEAAQQALRHVGAHLTETDHRKFHSV